MPDLSVGQFWQLNLDIYATDSRPAIQHQNHIFKCEQMGKFLRQLHTHTNAVNFGRVIIKARTFVNLNCSIYALVDNLCATAVSSVYSLEDFLEGWTPRVTLALG